MTIINDDARVVNKLEASLTGDARVVIYDRHMFIVQASGEEWRSECPIRKWREGVWIEKKRIKTIENILINLSSNCRQRTGKNNGEKTSSVDVIKFLWRLG